MHTRIVPLMIAAALVGCTSEDPTETPLPDANVVSYAMTTTIDAGTEVEHCRFVTAPAEGILVNRDEVRFAEGSHHVLLFETTYDEIPTDLDYLNEEQGVFDCSDGVFFEYGATRIISGSQNFSGDSLIAFPADVAMRVEPHSVLLLNAHYINTTTSPLTTEVELMLHTIDEDALSQEGDVMFFFDLFLKVPQQGTSNATMICDITEDITVSSAQSHMHARGVDFEAYVTDPDGNREQFYTTTEWENVPVERFAPGMQVSAGSRIEHTCFHQNDTNADIFMGQRTTDEMCVLFGSYYPAYRHVSLCSGVEDSPEETLFFGAEWPGQGTATCAESQTCFFDATGAGGGMFGIVREITQCIIDADPAISREFSDVVGCSLSSFLTSTDPVESCGAKYATCGAL